MNSQQDLDCAADFSATPKTDEELAQWCERLAGLGNQDLRQLVKEAQVMRWCARILLERLQQSGGLPSAGPPYTALAHAVRLIQARGPIK